PVINNIRAKIEEHGGEVNFNAHVTDLLISDSPARRITGVEINGKEIRKADAVILATGHSARDIFQLLNRRKIFIEAKPFALGVRIEHPQPFVDQCQYGVEHGSAHLPAAAYALNSQVDGRGVFSFCMCPGGLIVPAATAPGEIVVNGMSLSRRDSPYANSGVVTSVELNDLQKYFLKNSTPLSALTGVEFQSAVEQAMFKAGDGSQAAPAQLVADFLKKQVSKALPATSYIPGLISAPLHQLLPPWIYDRLTAGIKQFDQKMKGYIHPEAVVVATESRTSSPVRIPRDPATGVHIEVKGLYPCGEGAGYAGGIMSAALDGQYLAGLVAKELKVK
ncbi:MAG TPA: hypothetical protein VJ508_10880, partial [Saprospiraceae bacterium]|nr:hypothetical protein [Saprospiraceae bacterium]